MTTETNTVYIVTRPRENKFGWTPDLSDAARYGKLKIIFEPEDKPQFEPSKAVDTARKQMEGFSPDDYLLWAGGGDPIAVMVACMIASEESDEVNVLRWERNFDEGERDRRKGWYLPVKLNLARKLFLHFIDIMGCYTIYSIVGLVIVI